MKSPEESWSQGLAYLALVGIVGLDMSDVMPGQFVDGSLQGGKVTIKLSLCQQQMLNTSISIIPLSSLIFLVENLV